MQKIALLFLGLIAVVAMGILIVEISDTLTGNYASSGGGRWAQGPVTIHMQPAEACTYAGFIPTTPQRVETNDWGTAMSVCWNGQTYVTTPIVRTVIFNK